MAAAPADTSGASVDPQRFEAVSALFSSLDKALKGLQLYTGGGPLVERLLDDLEMKATAAVRDGDVTVRVASVGLVYGGRPLNPDDKRRPYLFRLFCDGVRELTIQNGVEREELRALVETLRSEPGKSEEDVVTILWERELKHIHLYVADVFANGAQLSNDGELTLAQGGERARLDPTGSGAALNLSPDDLRMLRVGDQLKWLEQVRAISHPSHRSESDAEHFAHDFKTLRDFQRFLDIALEVAEHDAAAGESPSASPLVLGQFDALIDLGDAEGLAQILTLAGEAAREGGPAALALRDGLTAPERMRRLAPLYQRDPQTLTAPIIAMVEGAQAGLLAMLTELPTGEPQKLLQGALSLIDVDLTPFYVRRLQDEDEKVVVDAVVSLGRIATPDAQQALGKMLSSTAAPVRLAALQAMAGHYHESARPALARALRDPTRESRLLALQILKGSNDPRAVASVLPNVEDPSFDTRDPEEQKALYNALAAFRDERTFEHFRGVLEEKNLTRSKNIIQRQLLVVETLGQVGDESSIELLRKTRSHWYLPGKVKQAIDANLSRGRS